MQNTPKNIFLLVIRNPLNKFFSIQMYISSNERADSLRRLTKYKAQNNSAIEFTFFDMYPDEKSTVNPSYRMQDESGLTFTFINNDDATFDAFISGYTPKVHTEEVIL